MLPGMHLRSMRLSNNSPTSGFDLFGCKDLEDGKYVWLFFTMLCFVVGFPASIAILWEMFKAHRRGSHFTPNDFFVLNLSTMDAVFLVFIPPGILNHYTWKNWHFELSWNVVYTLSTCGRPLLMACVCLDCYLAVVHPITYHKRKSLIPRVVMVGIVWILTVASGIAYGLFYMLYTTIFSIVPFIVAVVIIGICDSFILHSLIKSDPGRKNIHPQKQRAIQTLINSLVMTVLSYLPPVLLFGMGKPLISSQHIFICAIYVFNTIPSSLGSAVMPILHLKNLGKLDRFLISYIIRCCRS